MAKLNVIVAVSDVSAFERLLASVKRQTVSGIDVTAVTNKNQNLKELKKKYEFNIVESKGSVISSVNEAVNKSASEYVMIAAQVQLFEIDFFETASAYLDDNDLIAMNISKYHRSRNFFKIYPAEDMSAEKCLSIRPCVNNWIISKSLLKKNSIKIKSFSLSDQLDFLKECLAHSEKNCYIPQSRIFIERIWSVTGRSFIKALSKGEYSYVIIRQSFSDCFEILTGTKLYKLAGRLKRLTKMVLKRLIKRLLKRLLKR